MGLTSSERLDLYNETTDMIRITLGDKEGTGGRCFFRDGFDSFHCFIFDDQISFFNKINRIINPDKKWLNGQLVKRWQLVNQLIISGYSEKEECNNLIKENMLILAGLVAYPLFEEVARRISNAWDEEGRLSIDIEESRGLTRINSRGQKEPHKYLKGHRIVDLSHKLEIMMDYLDKGLQKAIRSLDQRMRKSPLGEKKDVFGSLFENLQRNRDTLSHGREFEGWEAIYISLIISMIYFRPLESEVNTEIERSKSKSVNYYPAHELTRSRYRC